MPKIRYVLFCFVKKIKSWHASCFIKECKMRKAKNKNVSK